MKFIKSESGEIGTVIEVAIGLTILLIVLGYVMAPVGLQAFDDVDTANITSITAGTTGGNIWAAIVPIILATLILSVVMVVKKVSS